MSKTSSKTTKEGGTLGSEGFNTCVIASGTKIEGNFQSAENIRLDGEVIGDLTCEKKLVLGPGGKIHGNVSAREAVVMGTILGDLEVVSGLMLDKTAWVKGKVRAATVGIEEGAFYTGACATTK
ncbi:MAG: polymer-forming cytoskeletal protein [Haliscomenobacter sp.]